MASDPKPRLSGGELDLMDLLWRQGPLTLAAAHSQFSANRFAGKTVGYTTIQTRLNRLVDKGLATKSGRPAEYAAAVDRQAVQAGHLDQLIAKLAGGSVVPLVTQLMQDRRISRQELDELKQLIETAELDVDDSNPATMTAKPSGSRRAKK